MTTSSGHTTAILASKVKGTAVYDGAGDRIGTVEDIVLDGNLHASFSLRGERVTVPLHGEHQVRNAALALAPEWGGSSRSGP